MRERGLRGDTSHSHRVEPQHNTGTCCTWGWMSLTATGVRLRGSARSFSDPLNTCATHPADRG